MNATTKFEKIAIPAPLGAGSLADCLAFVPDPRLDRTRKHALRDILFTAVCALLCGYHSYYDMEDFCREFLPWLRLRVPLAGGAPSHDTFRRVLGLVDPRHVLRAFRLWAGAAGAEAGQIVLDGKALRRAKNAGGAIPYIVNAWAVRSRLMLGGEQVLDKENEISAIPRVLEWLNPEGALVSIDAIGCQTRIAALIRAKGGDYLLALKDNHPAVRAEMETFLSDALANGESHVDTFDTVEKGHGRLERRVCHVSSHLDWFADRKKWSGLACVAMVESRRTIPGRESTVERRLYLCSRPLSARKALEAVRAHWGIESTHWVLDIAFDEDASRARTGHAPENLAHLRRMAYDALRFERDSSPEPGDAPSLRYKALQRRAARDGAFRNRLLDNFLAATLLPSA